MAFSLVTSIDFSRSANRIAFWSSGIRGMRLHRCIQYSDCALHPGNVVHIFFCSGNYTESNFRRCFKAFIKLFCRDRHTMQLWWINEHHFKWITSDRFYLSLQGISKIFDFTLVKDLIDTCVKKRDGFNRSLVWSCITCLTFLLIVFEGDFAIGYLFTSARLGWTVEKYSIYVAANVVVAVLGTVSGIKLLRKYAGIVF